ncbi:MAG TPA: nitrilase-related carbon-nitrogen hydrolase [Candidatus Norongarragalinales archaeon]|nr:nitrilase-related carbon-nitrogen hydrolase [Candidatus Norongarragalinales archaeon]
MVKLAAVQFEGSSDYRENVERAAEHVKEAAKNGAKLVCLPEYFYSSLSLSEIVAKSAEINSFVKNQMDDLAKTLDIVIAYNVPKCAAGKIENTTVVTSRKGEIGGYPKTCLFPNKPFNESEYFQRGNTSPVFDLGFANVGFAICYDLRFPEIFRKLALKGAEVIFVPAAFPKDKVHQVRTLLAARAIENQLFVVGVNKTGKDKKSEYAANTMFVSPKGFVLSEARGRAEEVVYANINLQEIKRLRNKVSYLESAKIFY